jgi:hypothetical protein
MLKSMAFLGTTYMDYLYMVLADRPNLATISGISSPVAAGSKHLLPTEVDRKVSHAVLVLTFS